LAGLDEVASVAAAVGGEGFGQGINTGLVTAKLKPQSERTRSARDVTALLRPLLAALPDAHIVVREMKMMGGGRQQGDIEVEVIGTEMEGILALADSVVERMHDVAGLTDITLSYKGVRPELKLIPDRERLEHYGLTPNVAAATTVQALGGILRFSMTGNEQAVYREGDKEYPIRVQLAPSDRDDVDDIESMTIATPSGPVPLRALVAIEEAGGPSSVTRKNRQRMVSVTANVSEGTSGAKVSELRRRFSEIPLLPGYRVRFGGMQEMMDESFAQLVTAGLLAVVLTYMVLVGILESLSMALVIWLTLPLGLIGVIWALFFTGNAFSMISNMSIIMLIGIVVNNAILIIDYARQERRSRGLAPREAIVEAAVTKLKAIIMMNLAIILAMLPQALSLGSGGEIRAPFAITAIGGIVVSTLLTLFVTPVLYVVTAPKAPPAPGNG
jgi:HAE1 family hydrophobic/amphiphilic exporter-1